MPFLTSGPAWGAEKAVWNAPAVAPAGGQFQGFPPAHSILVGRMVAVKRGESSSTPRNALFSSILIPTAPDSLVSIFAWEAAVQLVPLQPVPRLPFSPDDGRTRQRIKRDRCHAVFVAYPAEYRSSGVMTFVATGEGAVFDTILGAARRKWQRPYPLGVWIPVGISPNDEMHDELVAISPKAEIEI